jgi:hypothetical protein
MTPAEMKRKKPLPLITLRTVRATVKQKSTVVTKTRAPAPVVDNAWLDELFDDSDNDDLSLTVDHQSSSDEGSESEPFASVKALAVDFESSPDEGSDSDPFTSVRAPSATPEVSVSEPESASTTSAGLSSYAQKQSSEEPGLSDDTTKTKTKTKTVKTSKEVGIAKRISKSNTSGSSKTKATTAKGQGSRGSKVPRSEMKRFVLG